MRHASIETLTHLFKKHWIIVCEPYSLLFTEMASLGLGSLSRLPQEIRDLIWDELAPLGWHRQKTDLAILCTSKQLQAEIISHLHKVIKSIAFCIRPDYDRQFPGFQMLLQIVSTRKRWYCFHVGLCQRWRCYKQRTGILTTTYHTYCRLNYASRFEWSRTADLSVWNDPITGAYIAENGQAYQVIDDRPDA